MLFGESKHLEQLVMDVLNEEDGLTDIEITEKLSKEEIAIHTVNNICSQLQHKGKLYRVRNEGKGMMNHLVRDN